MTSYLAIIKDCFREAKASLALRGILVLLTLLLLLLLPMGIAQRLTTGLSSEDIRDWPAVIQQLRNAAPSPQPSPEARIWSMLDQRMRERLQQYGRDRSPTDQTDRIVEAQFARQLGRLLDRRDFYDPRAYRNVRVRVEGQQLLKLGIDELSDQQVQRLNRILLESTLRGNIQISEPTSIAITYLRWNTGQWLPLSKEQLFTAINNATNNAMHYIFGPIGVFVAILFTAPIIPRMFDTGSISLLLSKPISRSLLLLSKFAGGCSFILIYVAYLMFGLWLILGLRLGIWNYRPLLFIPLYMFTFSIYYAVSTLAGVLWRSTVVSIVACILFWTICFLLGTTNATMQGWIDETRIERLILIGDQLLAVDQTGFTHEWDEALNRWQTCFLNEEQQEGGRFLWRISGEPSFGPVYDRRANRLIAVQGSYQNRRNHFHVGYQHDGWDNLQGIEVPRAVVSLLIDAQDRPLLVTSVGVLELRGGPRPSAAGSTASGPQAPGVVEQWADRLSFSIDWIPGLGGLKTTALRRVDDPDSWPPLMPPWQAAIDPVEGTMAIHGNGRLFIFQQDSQGRYQRSRSTSIRSRPSTVTSLALVDNTLITGWRDGHVSQWDAGRLELLQEFPAPGRGAVRLVRPVPGGERFAVLYANRQCWMLDGQGGQLSLPALRGQGDISAVEFTSDGRLLVADRATRVTLYSEWLEQVDRSWEPAPSWLDRAFRYGIRPLYLLLPQPGELDRTMAAVLDMDDQSSSSNPPSSPIEAPRNPWLPIWSSLAFMAVVLGFSCVYFQRLQF